MSGAFTKDILEKIEGVSKRLKQAGDEAKSIVIGQDRVVDQSIITLLSGGNALFISVPGLAKTTLVETLSKVFGLQSGRIQFTPDTMPTDITGMEIWEKDAEGRNVPAVKKGPVFCQLLLGDEINRASPRTQSALLQPMAEGFVTIGNKNYSMATPFHVFATQNPIEQEGTNPLPEAQLDRFLLAIEMTYPDAESEKKIVNNTTFTPLDPSIFDEEREELPPVRNAPQKKPSAMFSARELVQAQHIVRGMPISKEVMDGINALTRAMRPDDISAADDVKKYVRIGAGFRPQQAFALAARAKALYEGRLSPSLEDVRDLAIPILKHRISLNEALAKRDGKTEEAIIMDTAKRVLKL